MRFLLDWSQEWAPVPVLFGIVSQNAVISGEADFAEQKLLDIIISGSENCPASVEAGVELGTNRERERLATYFHDQLAPDLMSVAFAVEAIRSELEIENHPAEAKLAQVRDRLSKMLQPIRESILGLSERDR